MSFQRLLRLLFVLAASGCTLHSHYTEFHELPGPLGERLEYQRTTTYSLCLFYLVPILGDPDIERTVGKFTAEAKARDGKFIDIQDTNRTTLWFVLPPITFIVHPVITEVQGQVGYTDPRMPGTSVPPPANATDESEDVR